MILKYRITVNSSLVLPDRLFLFVFVVVEKESSDIASILTAWCSDTLAL